jgi:hypothetical protein
VLNALLPAQGTLDPPNAIITGHTLDPDILGFEDFTPHLIFPGFHIV